MIEEADDPGQTEDIGIDVPGAILNLIDRAAQATGKTRLEFIVEAAQRDAEQVLLNHAIAAPSADTGRPA